MKHLRERGIYLAPNGERFVASRERKTTSDGKRILSRLGSRLSCYLFGRYEWAFHGTPDYEVATTGKPTLSFNEELGLVMQLIREPSGSGVAIYIANNCTPNTFPT
jgi:hypothetical protein